MKIFLKRLSCSIIFLGLYSNICFAESPQILMLNSNSDIPKYQKAQQYFEKNQNYSITSINLKGADLEALETKITKSDIIYAIGASAYNYTYNLEIDTPVVFSSIINWRRLPKRSAHTYGVANELPAGMQLMMYRYFFPELEKIGVIYSPKINQEWLDEAIMTGENVGVQIVSIAVDSAEELEQGVDLEQLLNQVDALWLISDPVIATEENISKIFQTSEKLQKPVFAYHEVFIKKGAVLAISADVPTISHQVVTLIDDMVKNKEITEPVVFPAGSHIVLSRKALKQYPKLKLNEQALDSVHQIIE